MTSPPARKIDEAYYREASLDEWAENLWGIYRRQDERLRLDEIWGEAVRDATKVEEAIREGKLSNALEALAHSFCWTACFAQKIKNDPTVAKPFRATEFQSLSRVVWSKYPNACATCRKSSCICPILPQDEKPTKKDMRRFLHERVAEGDPPAKMAEWEALFRHVYDTAHFTKDIGNIVSHYLEEEGEVLGAIRNLALTTIDDPRLSELQEDLIEEVADTISWTLSIVRKVQLQVEDTRAVVKKMYGARRSVSVPDVTMAELLWSTYQLDDKNELGCPCCKQPLCEPDGICRVAPRFFTA